MYAIIEGKRYDTETATKIGGARSSGHYGMSDFHYWSAALYVTKNGRFFLAGEGGALTRFSKRIGQNGSCGGEKLIPLDRDEAREWAEWHLGADAVETHFAADIEDA